jgi:hypothetical protein
MSLSTLADSVVSGTSRQILAENDQLWVEKSAGILRKIPASLVETPEGQYLFCQSKVTGSADGERLRRKRPQQFVNSYRA